jgi:RND family efflux transporter MFP subunit
LTIRKDRLGREIEAQQARRDALKLRLELKTDETRALADAEAQIDAAGAKVAQAETVVATARLRLDRMTVRAPVAGRVLALVARPGSRLMGQTAVGPQDASTVVTMFDPKRLQIRADVRLEDVPRVQPGQPVKIETPAAPGGPLDGRVLFPTSQTDIQKNTLQVKVAIDDPPPTIHPDMLVQITFLAPDTAPPSAGREQLRLLVPRALVETADGHAHVWLADRAAGVARMRPVQLGAAAGDLVEISGGLNAADRVIAAGRDGLRDGDRITVTGEEAPAAAPRPGNLVRPRRLNPGRGEADAKHSGK